MGRISAAHTAGLDLIDKLFFNQVLVACCFSDERHWLRELGEDIDRQLDARGIVEADRHLLKHGVLCFMEASLSESLLLLQEVYPEHLPALPEDMSVDSYEEVSEHLLTVFKGFTLGVLSKLHGCDIDATLEIADPLLDKYRKAPATVRYRLVERMFAVEFTDASIDCFAWLSKMGVLDSVKHPGKALASCHPPGFLQRLALLCEFDLQRDWAGRAKPGSGASGKIGVDEVLKVREPSPQMLARLLEYEARVKQAGVLPSLKHSFPFIEQDRLEDPARVTRFFTSVNAYGLRLRTFQGSLASWTGMLCGGAVEVRGRLAAPGKAIFTGSDDDDSRANDVRRAMSARGFEITSRAIYERHRDFRDTVLRAVGVYYDRQLAQDVAIPPDMSDLTYDALVAHFELLQPGPRRRRAPA